MKDFRIMTNITTATVIAGVERSIEQPEVQAIKNACDMFRTLNGHKEFYNEVQADSDEHETVAVPLDSAAGKQRVEEQLEKTAVRRIAHLEEILGVVDDADTVREAAESRDLIMPSRRLGVSHNPQTAYLYDEAYLAGDPVINREHVDDIIDEYEDQDGEFLYVVDVELRY